MQRLDKGSECWSGNALILLFLFVSAPLSVTTTQAQEDAPRQPDRVGIYQTTPQGELHFHLFEPMEETKSGDNPRPAILFFFGGGWTGGKPQQFYPQSRFFSGLGMTAICLEYRVSSVHGTTPFASVSDGRAALNYFHSHAGEFGIDPDKIVLAGGSAGGHVAACAALPGIRVPQDGPEKLDPPAVIPAALVLFNPVIDTSENGYGRRKIGEHWQWISPLHQVDATLPPTLILHGTADTTTPFTNVIEFREKARGLGRHCTVAAWPGEKHGFFNAGRRAYVSTLSEARNFLTNIGLITSP